MGGGQFLPPVLSFSTKENPSLDPGEASQIQVSHHQLCDDWLVAPTS